LPANLITQNVQEPLIPDLVPANFCRLYPIVDGNKTMLFSFYFPRKKTKSIDGKKPWFQAVSGFDSLGKTQQFNLGPVESQRFSEVSDHFLTCSGDSLVTLLGRSEMAGLLHGYKL